jgi:hypothetical protein
MVTPLNTNSLPHHVLFPLSIDNVKNHNHSPFKIKPRKLVLPEAENDDTGKENKQTVNGKTIQKANIHYNKQKQSKPLIVYEDSPTTAQIEKILVSNSKVKQKSVRTLRSKKTSQKEASSRHRVSEYESLSKVCQALEFRIDSPDSCFKTHQSSIKNRKQGLSSANNKKAVTPNLVNEEGVNLTYLGLQGLDVSISDIDNEVFQTSETLLASKQAGTLNRKASTSEIFCDMHVPVLKSCRQLRTYSRQNSKSQFIDKNRTSQEAVSEGIINRVKVDGPMNNENTVTAGKETCSSDKGSEITFPDSSLTARKTKGRGKSVCSYASVSVSSKSSLQENSNETLIKDMENLVLDPDKVSLSSGNDISKNSTKEEGYKKNMKGPQFLFTPSRKNVRKVHDETIALSSSPDEHLDSAGQTNKQSKKNKGNEWKKKVIISSSASEDETSSKLEADINSEEAAALPRIKSKKVVSTSKMRQLPLKQLETDINSEEEAVALPRIKSKKVVSASKRRRLPLRHHFILN